MEAARLPLGLHLRSVRQAGLVLLELQQDRMTRMTDAEFRVLVLEMREAQKQYFKTRDASHLRAAKDYERRVDVELIDKKQPGFFDP